MLKVYLYTQEERDEWEGYVDGCPKSTFYHRIGWKRIIEDALGHRTYYLMAKDGNKTVGILPLVLMKSRVIGKFLVSMPFLNYAGICADEPDAETLLLKEAIDITIREDVDCLELRQPYKLTQEMPTSENKVTMFIDVSPDPEVTLSHLDKKVRNKIMRAERLGLRCETGGQEHLDGFYETFATNQRKLGSPVFGRNLFESVLLEFPEEAKIFSVIYEGRVIATSFVASFKKTVEGLWAGSLREFFKLWPNEFLYWKNIEFAGRSGFSRFNLGRSTKDSGPFKFKMKFGAQVNQLYWQYYLNRVEQIPQASPDALKYRIATGIWKHLPLRMTKTLGPHIRKHMPQ